jgi:ATP-binding cassette subfamily F protein uup
MDKIVDLFIFRGGVENFPGNYSDFKSLRNGMWLKRRNKAEKKDWKQNNPTGNLTFNEQKEFQKLEREIKDLEEQKKLKLSFYLLKCNR